MIVAACGLAEIRAGGAFGIALFLVQVLALTYKKPMPALRQASLLPIYWTVRVNVVVCAANAPEVPVTVTV
jgi:hypothetical protein